MARGWIVAVTIAAGCTSAVDEPTALTLETAGPLDVVFAPGVPAAPIGVRVVARTADGTEVDVTADASFELIGAPLGAVADGLFASDARTVGEARLVAHYGILEAAAPATARAVGARTIAGTPDGAQGWFAAALDEAVASQLAPGDGAVLPPNLGALDIHFAAPDLDDVHELGIAAPYIDLRVWGPGAAGPRRVDLTAAEWDVVTHNNRGGAFDLRVRSLASTAPGTAHVASARIALTDTDLAGEILYGAVPTDPVAAADTGLWSYDLAAATTGPWYVGADRPAGIRQCVGCHASVSPDGSRIAVVGFDAADAIGSGQILDTATRQPLSVQTPETRWNSSAFDPGGRLVTAHDGVLTLRDGTTADPIATLVTAGTAVNPTIAPDGRTLAYGLATEPPLEASAGTSLVAHDWDAATGTLGPVRTILTAAAGDGIRLPEYSRDGAWILYSRSRGVGQATERIGIGLVPASGGAPVVIGEERDARARWVSAPAPTRWGGGAPESLAWIAISSGRPVGASDQTAVPQLWLVAVLLDRVGGTEPAAAVPFRLPGQALGVGVRHIAVVLPPRP